MREQLSCHSEDDGQGADRVQTGCGYYRRRHRINREKLFHRDDQCAADSTWAATLLAISSYTRVVPAGDFNEVFNGLHYP